MVVNNWIAANLIWITLVIAIIVLIYFVFTIIQTIRKKRRFVSQLGIILLILGLMFLIFLTYRASEIEGAAWGQVILMIGLVSVTAAYASSTEKQAEASIKMAKEMREQRLTVSQPLVFPDFTNVKYPEQMAVLFRNLGNGPALNITITFAYANADIIQQEWSERTGPSYSKLTIVDNSSRTIIEAGQEIHCKPYLAECNQGNIGTAFAEYSDIYGRWFLAGWEYHCEKDSKGRIIMQPNKPIYPIVREGDKP